MFSRSPWHLAIDQAGARTESEAVASILEQLPWPHQLPTAIRNQAHRWAEHLRHQAQTTSNPLIQQLLHRFPLSTPEGSALMALAEALLRIPDPATRYQLIRDQIRQGQWDIPLNSNSSLLTQGMQLGLLATQRLLAPLNKPAHSFKDHVQQHIGHLAEPCTQYLIARFIQRLSQEFIGGANLVRALKKTQKASTLFRHSYDMLGEAALTHAEAAHYRQAYQQAIQILGSQVNPQSTVDERPNLSIKLSALHPRYSRAQQASVHKRLYPVLLELAQESQRQGISLTFDAEEADRLTLSLELLERLCHEPSLAHWQGLGYAVQAYQKRAPAVIDALVGLAQTTQHRLMIRLVKGAYWDTEIKQAQQEGWANYPVYTRKHHTDLAYMLCASRLLAAQAVIYPQFATHNVLTIATIQHLAQTQYPHSSYEFQCLYGMGETIYGSLSDELKVACRRYVPVGTPEALLPYLVRRMLENGASTAFVNHIANPDCRLDEVLQDPIALTQAYAKQEGLLGQPHPHIPSPAQLVGADRQCAMVENLNEEAVIQRFANALEESHQYRWGARSQIANAHPFGDTPMPHYNPANSKDLLGHVIGVTPKHIEQALQQAAQKDPQGWSNYLPEKRAAILEQAADQLAQKPLYAFCLLVREAGKTWPNALAEIREAVDFLRYYAAQLHNGSVHNTTHHPLGTVLCISPWNFPLAIFIGQIAAALAAGNTVIAKPASQTPFIADWATRLLHQAGVPKNALQLLLGSGEQIGAPLVQDARIQAVLFTGSTPVAKQIQLHLANRRNAQGHAIPLIAETGGLNAMIVDSSALAEQAVCSIIASAFDSAGQRCSALRLLCIQEDVADNLIEQLQGAMAERTVGDPCQLSTDIGPVIDTHAKAHLEDYIQRQRTQGRSVIALACPQTAEWGQFVQPTLIELTHVDQLTQEVFGPVLHWIRYPRTGLKSLLEQIQAAGYGLTFGLQSRLDSTLNRLIHHSAVGNTYVNRSQVGALVGIQPFGGEGLSGTGPKAGGPLYFYRLLKTYPNQAPFQVLSQGLPTSLRIGRSTASIPTLQALMVWARHHAPEWAGQCEDYARYSFINYQQSLRGPAGEDNEYRLVPRRVLGLAEHPQDLFNQLAAVLACNGQLFWPDGPITRAFYQELPERIKQHITLFNPESTAPYLPQVALIHGEPKVRRVHLQRLARDYTPLIPAYTLNSGDARIALEWLMLERVLTVNTAARGGNTQLTTLSEPPILRAG